MRKCIKGALELNNINHTDSNVDFFDVAHLISPEQDNEINDIHENGAPVVVSALYAEDDPYARYTEYIEETKSTVLTPKALKFLNRVDLILVPAESAKEFLIRSGVNKHIEVCHPAVNLSRFDFTKEEEKEIFFRYYREDHDKKIVVAVGEYNVKMSGLTSFINAAKKSPKASFYYIGRLTPRAKISLRISRIINNAPKNVKFIDVPEDDIYRSALLNATVLLVPGYKYTGATLITEAMAAKTQIIARKSAVFNELLTDGVTAHIAEFSETLSSLTKDYLEGKIKPTTNQAYQYISLHSLNEFGEELNKFYQLAIKDNVHRRF